MDGNGNENEKMGMKNGDDIKLKKSNTFNWIFSSPVLALTKTFKLTSKCSEINNNKEETFWVARERGSRRAVTEKEESGLSIENNLY